MLWVAPDQANQIWDSPLQGLCCRGLDVLSPGKHHALYSEPKQHKSAFIKLYKPHDRQKKIKNQENRSNKSITHHSLDNIIWPCQFARPLTGRHTLPVFVNERYDVLYKRPNNTTETIIRKSWHYNQLTSAESVPYL